MPTPKEERAGGNAVIEHLVDRALNRDGVEGEDAEDHEAQVADRSVGDEALQIGLHGGYERAVDDADNRENGDEARAIVSGLGKKRQAEAQMP